MGIPDFLKFAARSSPTALCRMTKGASAAPVCFDFILIDATNACQTIGLETLAEFLMQPQLKVRRAVVFAIDAQRHRAGTSRSYRTHATVLDADVAIQRLCGDLQRHYKQLASVDAQRPQILVSGRQVAGEADYKILDIQRQLVMQAFAAKEELPTFCFVSEDSDVLCGAICGPAPHTVTIATKLHDTMFEMCLLRVTHVLAYIAKCVDVLGGTDGGEETPQEHQQPSTENGGVEKEDNEGENVFHRRKQDGPMVATGIRVVLSDSDSDVSDVDEGGKVKSLPACMPVKMAQYTAEAEILQNSSIDLVFLFIVLMGNGSNVPPVVRGATKVDIQSCWNAYCRMKYNTAEFGCEEMGRSLLDLDVLSRPVQQSNEIASIAVDCFLLRAILESAHYADAHSRPPVEEEKERALLFLSQAVYTTLRYIIACNVHLDSALEETFLDTRPLMETEVVVPSLAAFLWVLGLTKKRTFYFPLVGLADEGVLLSATKGMLAVEAAVAAARSRRNHSNQNVVLDWDVGNTLVASGTGAFRRVQLQSLCPRSRSGACKDMVACINTCAEDAVRNRGVTVGNGLLQGSKLALFSRLLLAWQSTMTSLMPALKVIEHRENVASSLKENDSHKHMSGRPCGAAMETRNADVKLSYSFELRRMAPVLTGGDNEHRSGTATNSALLQALRVSYDYTKASSTAEMSREGASEGETPSSRLERGNKKGKQSAMGTASPARKRRQTEGAMKSSADGERRDSKSGKYRRPGKKERQRAKMAKDGR
ncbi:hypothetical protein TraAM80_04704 [Trypanosoma rangeli]|uniref:Uncharacterized protein n=1 Tax=Trypanosoma rangeli TaxID=5698 RepID=A0A422NID2_TRYRA|nr:uncharacterized protein TraAM80_04704 [Trypanosoma rangeli]RNF05144.1 hypothetical protein TraAM80_04704 [Trypanosoma rangeli]|eukprot:RNF05144.1 hypothetical protein TraAM80_04704 [Trypanosoma rangeli]